MNREEIMKTLTDLKGIGAAKAEALLSAGYNSIEKICSASIDDLTAVPGISPTVATSIQQQLKQIKPKPSVKQSKKGRETISSPKTGEEKTTQKSPSLKPSPTKTPKKKSSGKKEGYNPKKKPDLPEDISKYLPVRKKIKQRTPHFYREEWFRYKRLGKSWRRPDGITSKMRRNFKYRPNRVRVGYRGPQKTRDLHPSGFQEVLVYNTEDLKSIDPKIQAARIGGTVGMRKRMEIEKKAKELDVRILNNQR